MNRTQAGLVLAVAQVALVGTLGLKLLVDRARLPRAWVRTMPFDPSTPLRGRYVRLAVEIPVADVPAGMGSYSQVGVRLRSVDGRIVGQIDDSVDSPRVELRQESGIWSSRLSQPIAFFIPEHVQDPSTRPPGDELWAEVTIPATGPPRPIRLGVMKEGKLTALELR